jgi:hypothetical protein
MGAYFLAGNRRALMQPSEKICVHQCGSNQFSGVLAITVAKNL